MEDIIKKARDLKPGDKIYYYHRGKIYERKIAEINWDQNYIVCFSRGKLYSTGKRLRLYRYGYSSENNSDMLYVQYTKYYTSPESVKKHIQSDINVQKFKVDMIKNKMNFHQNIADNKTKALNAFLEKKVAV